MKGVDFEKVFHHTRDKLVALTEQVRQQHNALAALQNKQHRDCLELKQLREAV